MTVYFGGSRKTGPKNIVFGRSGRVWWCQRDVLFPLDILCKSLLCQKTEFEAQIRATGECFHCPADPMDRPADASITIIIMPKKSNVINGRLNGPLIISDTFTAQPNQKKTLFKGPFIHKFSLSLYISLSLPGQKIPINNKYKHCLAIMTLV